MGRKNEVYAENVALSEDGKAVVILDQTAASSLFQEEEPLGKTIEIGQQPYVVV